MSNDAVRKSKYYYYRKYLFEWITPSHLIALPPQKDDKNVRLSTGDFYITHHSNLAEVHVVCHLVADESVRTVTTDISSRHPVLLGYRNVLKACFRYDIRTITLPLLLVHEMSEVMAQQGVYSCGVY